MLHHLLDWLYTHTGTEGSGPWYGFWSGFGSDIGEVAIIGGLVHLVRQHNCHVKGCLRIARHELEGTPYKLCATHHPSVPTGGVTAEHITTQHLLHLGRGHHDEGTDGTH